MEMLVGDCKSYGKWYILIVTSINQLAENSIQKVCISALLYKSTSNSVKIVSGLKR